MPRASLRSVLLICAFSTACMCRVSTQITGNSASAITLNSHCDSGPAFSPIRLKLEEFAEQILDLIAQQPDLTLVETVAELRKRRIRTSRSSLWRFLDRHGITLKKKPASCRTAASGCGASTPTLDPRARHA